MPAREAARKLNESHIFCKERRKDKKSCPVRDMLDHISDKWSVIILITLSRHPHRFGELLREIDGISQRMLTETLSDLQRDGLINRTVYPTKPPSVEYSLTTLGESLMIPLWELVYWANTHSKKIQIARERFIHNGNNSNKG